MALQAVRPSRTPGSLWLAAALGRNVRQRPGARAALVEPARRHDGTVNAAALAARLQSLYPVPAKLQAGLQAGLQDGLREDLLLKLR